MIYCIPYTIQAAHLRTKQHELCNLYAVYIHNSVKDLRKRSDSRVLKKYLTKLVQRIALVLLKPVVAPWRYKKSRQVLLPTLLTENETETETEAETGDEKKKEKSKAEAIGDESSDKKDESTTVDVVRKTGIKGQSSSSSSSSSQQQEEHEEGAEEQEIPEDLEVIVDQLLRALRDRDNIVRWSAAKGIGRIAMRLNKSLGDQVVSDVLECLTPTEDCESWHGGCLCLAELARRGLLLPRRLPEVMSRLEKAMLYDKFQGNRSKGDDVRDAACYVAWAFARAYEANIMAPFVSTLARGLLVMACYDREIHCRRAACAAFQENVGRQGYFPHGIEIITTADYWSVGLIQNAFVTVSYSIAKFDEYKHHMIQHLVNEKLNHWCVYTVYSIHYTVH